MIRRRLAGRLVGRLEIPEMRYVHQTVFSQQWTEI